MTAAGAQLSLLQPGDCFCTHSVPVLPVSATLFVRARSPPSLSTFPLCLTARSDVDAFRAFLSLNDTDKRHRKERLDPELPRAHDSWTPETGCRQVIVCNMLACTTAAVWLCELHWLGLRAMAERIPAYASSLNAPCIPSREKMR